MSDGHSASSSLVENRRKKLMMKVREMEMSREERMELASYLLRRDITTWKTLTDEQASRLLDAVEGWEMIEHLRSMR